jgi:hypothetical protein
LEFIQQLSRDTIDLQQQMDGYLREVVDARSRVSQFDERIAQLEAFLGLGDEDADGQTANEPSEVTA